MNKKLFTILAILTLTLTLATPIAYAKKDDNNGKHLAKAVGKPENVGPKRHAYGHGHDYFQQLKLKYSSDTLPWDCVPGNQISGYKMILSENPEEYYYLDIMSIKLNEELDNGRYPIYIDTAPEGFLDWWSTEKGVDGVDDEGTWKEYMFDSIMGDEPICYLTVMDGEYHLIDGLLYQLTGVDETFRINGDYPLGEYSLRLELDSHIEYFTMVFKPLTLE